MNKVLIFSSKLHPFKPRLEEISHNSVLYESHYDDLCFILPNQGKQGIKITAGGLDLKDFDLVFFRHGEKYAQFVSTISNYLKIHDVPFIDECSYYEYSVSKLFQMLKLQFSDVPTPKTIVLSNEILAQSYEFLKRELGKDKFIMKENIASHGRNNFLITNESEFLKAVKLTTEKQNVVFLCQEYIPNNFDYRLVTIGYRVAVVKRRIRTDPKTHVNNTFQGARVEIVPLEELSELTDLAAKSAKIININIAGVDIIVSEEDHKPYILEVNKAPDITDAASLQAIADYLADFKA